MGADLADGELICAWGFMYGRWRAGDIWHDLAFVPARLARIAPINAQNNAKTMPNQCQNNAKSMGYNDGAV